VTAPGEKGMGKIAKDSTLEERSFFDVLRCSFLTEMVICYDATTPFYLLCFRGFRSRETYDDVVGQRMSIASLNATFKSRLFGTRQYVQ
jgi:hypothetical protein